MKVRMKVNLGTVDAKAHDLNAAECKADMTPNVNSEQGKWLLEAGHAEPVNEQTRVHSKVSDDEPATFAKEASLHRGVQDVSTTEDTEEHESPAASDTAPEAIDKISRMRSKEKLQEIADTDQRKSVVEAAQMRLLELEE